MAPSPPPHLPWRLSSCCSLPCASSWVAAARLLAGPAFRAPHLAPPPRADHPFLLLHASHLSPTEQQASAAVGQPCAPLYWTDQQPKGMLVKVRCRARRTFGVLYHEVLVLLVE
ncbi:hypothetical protein BS78_09G089700 [Paspalum vaginatum]|nr:hypothetical protein BS78_09G089700 [Paspalum vaginatum]